jgi:hypothetical protein
MSLIKEVVDLAVDRKSSVADLLRKCLVLAYELDNDRLRDWAELDGYQEDDEVPAYRKIHTHAAGLFLGPMGAQLKNQPLPSYQLRDEHRHWAEEAVLRQPISAYESFVNIREGDPREKENIALTWPANLTSLYQQSFYTGGVLSRAWIVVPRSNLIALVDLIRNKTLRLSLEIRKQLVQSNNDLAHISKNDVDRMVTNNIFGGNVVITNTATDLTQIGSVTINRGDTASLSAALSSVGIDQSGINRLLHAVEQDKADPEYTRKIGTRTSAWITNVARGGMKLSADIAKPILTSWLQQYLGL